MNTFNRTVLTLVLALATTETIAQGLSTLDTSLHDLGTQISIDNTIDRLDLIEHGVNNGLRSRLEKERALLDMTLPVNPLPSLQQLPETLTILTADSAPIFKEVEIAPGIRIIEKEWLVWSDKQVLSWPDSTKIYRMEESYLEALGMHYLRFWARENFDNESAVRALFPAEATVNIQRNFVFETQATITEKQVQSEQSNVKVCDSAMKIGMLDTAVDPSHAFFSNHQLLNYSALSPELSEAQHHGTAVASVLGARLPKAIIYAASVFYRRDAYSQGASTQTLLKGLNWLAKNKVSVINMSLAGPEDPFLKTAIASLSKKNITLVAAVGNAGPASPPLFPAAFAEVIAVTATDVENNIYRWAVQGEHVDFSARGVAVRVARTGNGYALESGTSLAAPIVSAHAACFISKMSADKEKLVSLLAESAQDLGEKGKDPVFGRGLLP